MISGIQIFLERRSKVHRLNQPAVFLKLVLIGIIFAFFYHFLLDIAGLNFPWNTFLFNPEDRFNDWYNTLNQASATNPYFDHSTKALAAYFPFAYFSLGWISYFPVEDSIRLYFSISFLLMLISAYLAVRHINKIKFYDVNFSKALLLFFLINLCNYPVIFSLDRGNIDLWIGLLVSIFIFSYNQSFKIIGILSLSIAIALKGYPVAFILILIADRKFLEAIYVVTIALLMFFLPIIFKWSSFEVNLIGFFRNIQLYYKIYVVGKGSVFASSDPYNAIRLILFGIRNLFARIFLINAEALSFEDLSAEILKIYSLITISYALLVSFFVIYVNDFKWKKILAVSLLAVLFPNVANDYKLCIFLGGIQYLLINQAHTLKQKKACIILVLLLIPKSYLFIFGKSISMLINPFLLIYLNWIVMYNPRNWSLAIVSFFKTNRNLIGIFRKNSR